MTHRLLLVGMLTLGAFFFTSCDTDGQAGSFEVNFTWAKDTEGNELKPDLATGQFYLTVRLYEWQKGADFPGDIAVYGKQLKQTEAIQMQVDGTPFDLGAVSYGDDRVVVAEIRKGADLTTDPLYTGMSELFSIEKGKHKIVDVLMAMKPYTGVDDNGNKVEAELQIVDENGTVKAYTNGTALEVHLRLTKAVNFTKVYIANKEELLKGEDGIAVELADMLPVTGVENAYDLPDAWDISKGLSETEMARPELKVYARLENDYGEGVLLIAKIALDDVLPVLALELNYPFANSVTIKKVQLLVSAEELITTDGLSIISEGMVFDCPESIEPSLSFICTAIDDDSLMDGEYDIVVTALDRAGNRSAKAETTLTVDKTEPTLAQAEIMPAKAKSGITVTIDFTASEELSELPQVQLGAVVPDCTQDAEDTKHYTCTHTVTGDEFDGIREVQVTLTDLAGNPNTLNPGSVDYDAAAPLVSGVTLLRYPAYPASADEENKTYYFSVKDPKTEEFVTATLYVYANEELGAAKSLAVSGPSELTFAEKGSTGSVAVFTYTLKDEDAAGEYTFSITWEDTIGNSITTPLDTKMVIDKTAPSSTAIDITKILYKRVPWGSDATGGTPRFSVIGSAGAVTDLDTAKDIYIYRSTTMSAGNLIGMAESLGADGSFTINELVGGDLPKIYASFVNRSGLKAVPELITEIEWTATMGGKVAGSTFENPHVYESRSWFTGTLFQKGSTEAGNIEGLHIIDNDNFLVGGGGTWASKSFNLTNPSARDHHTMAYDSARDKIILWGGWGAGNQDGNGAMWEWDGLNWLQIKPIDPEGDGNPPERYSANIMFYDSKHDHIILFSSKPQTIWTWNGTSWARRDSSDPEGDGDPNLNNIGTYYVETPMAYDSYRDIIMLLKSNDSDNTINETWEWNDLSWSWVKIKPSDPEGDGNPSPSSMYAMTYDSKRKKVVLFDTETWEWDGASWANMTPLASQDNDYPLGRWDQAMVYNAFRGKVLMFGGCHEGTPCRLPYNDSWEWDGTNWTKIIQIDLEGDGDPSPRSDHAMVYDSICNKTIMFGGHTGVVDNANTYSDETWEWHEESWINRTPKKTAEENAPSARYSLSAAYDDYSRSVITFGGKLNSGWSDETWKWNGLGWNRINLAVQPSPREEHSMIFDYNYGKIILFGGKTTAYPYRSNETWAWDDNQWTLLNPTTIPPARNGHAMTYDVIRGRVVLFGGETKDAYPYYSDETWEWDGTNWIQLNPTHKPSIRFGHAMTYDVKNKKVLLFGGADADTGGHQFNDTWAWDGTDWTLLSPTTIPSVRRGHTMIYDNSREQVLLFGGSPMNEEIWAWDGSDWAKITPTDPEDDLIPSTRYEHIMVYDNYHLKALLLGGQNGFYSLSDTWEWDSGTTARPGQTMRVFFPATGQTSNNIAVNSIFAQFNAGGTGHNGALAVNGATMYVWKEGGWFEVASNNNSSASPSALTYTTSDPDMINIIFLGEEDSLNFAVTPVAPNGVSTEMASVSVDYAEVVVRYTINE